MRPLLLLFVPILAKTLLALVCANLLFLPLPSAGHDRTSLLVFYSFPSLFTLALSSFEALKYGTSFAGT